MSRFLAIDIDQTRLHVLSGTVRGGLRFERSATIDLRTALTPETANACGKALKDGLRSAGVAPAPVVVLLGRDRVILKELKIPPVDPAEAPALVRFQASKESTESIESSVVDYYLLEQDTDGQFKVMAQIVKKDVLKAVQQMCTSAGLKLEGVSSRSVGAVAALRRSIAAGEVPAPESKQVPQAILTRGDRWAELVIARQGQVIFARPLGASALQSETALVGEIKRSLAVFNAQDARRSVEALYVGEAAGSAGWTGRLSSSLPIAVHRFDPIAAVAADTAPEDRGHFTALAGILEAKTGRDGLPINFAVPRKEKPKKDTTRSRLAAAVAITLLVVLGGLAFGYVMLMTKEGEVASLNRRKADAEAELQKLDNDKKRMKAVADWQGTQVNWLDELYDMTARMPDINSMRVESFLGIPLAQNKKGPQGKAIAKIEMKVATESGKGYDQLYKAMVSDRYLEVISNNKSGAGGIGFNRFNQVYILTAEVDRRKPSDYVRALTSVTAVKPSREEPKGGGSGFPGFPVGLPGGAGQ